MDPLSNMIIDFFAPDKDNTPSVEPVLPTEAQENKKVAEEKEAEARRKRRGVLRRTFTAPGSNFVQQTNIGRNTLTGA